MSKAPEPVPLVGQLLDGRYQIVREIASGGMSAVYEATHVKIGRTVAIKVLHRDMAGDPEVVARFLNEARAVGTFGHPNIVASTDFGELAGHVPYLVLEYLEGHTLSHEVRTEGPLPIRRVVRIAAQIASALEAAHARNVIHRDLTSANIFLVQREGSPDHVKVLDFGISKFMTADYAKPKTRRGLTMGTPEFMSPEQISDPDSVDARVDVYALGVIMYQMLAGQCPFTRMPLQSLLTQIVIEPPPPIERGGNPRGDAGDRGQGALQAPGERFASMRDMGLEIERLSRADLLGRRLGRPGGAMDSGPGAARSSCRDRRPVVPGAHRLRVDAGRRAVRFGLRARLRAADERAASRRRLPPVTDPADGDARARSHLRRAGARARQRLRPSPSCSGGGSTSRRAGAAGGSPAVRAGRAAAPDAAGPGPSAGDLARSPGAGDAARTNPSSPLRRRPSPPGPQPEVVEITAPGHEGRRFWITFDHPDRAGQQSPRRARRRRGDRGADGDRARWKGRRGRPGVPRRRRADERRAVRGTPHHRRPPPRRRAQAGQGDRRSRARGRRAASPPRRRRRHPRPWRTTAPKPGPALAKAEAPPAPKPASAVARQARGRVGCAPTQSRPAASIRSRRRSSSRATWVRSSAATSAARWTSPISRVASR